MFIIKKKSIELLSPARDYTTGIAAINHGADAVYIGYQRFGAREAAGNSLDDIEKLIRYAHLFHAKVYITINTILFESELDEVEKLIHQFYRMGADAIIIQDMGILEMNLPPIPLHASTQTNNVNSQKIKFLEDVGFQRVILARELSVDEIKIIREKTNIELEAFVHGALCVSYSGQCNFSQAITGRSANRGACAQPCRSTFDLVDGDGNVIVKNKHLLSLRDNNQSHNIEYLIDAGITSFKIEGRLKDEDYVKNVTAHYRRIIDRIIEKRNDLKRSSSGKIYIDFEPDLERTFNRSYTEYFAHGRQKNQASHNTQKSVGKLVGNVLNISDNSFTINSSEKLSNDDGLCFFNRNGILTGIKVNRIEGNRVFPLKMNGLHKGATIYRNNDIAFGKLLSESLSTRKISCKVDVTIDNNEVVLRIEDEDKIKSSITRSFEFSKAKNPESAKETIIKQLSKTGETVYRVSDLNISLKVDEIPFFTISQLNGWRRELFDIHSQKRNESYKRNTFTLQPNSIPFPAKILDYRANIANSLAKRFYQRHGVEKFDEAFELQTEYHGKQLMETRYCILHELDYCDGKGKNRMAGKKLYLKDNINMYPLVFDCRNCRMKVLYP